MRRLLLNALIVAMLAAVGVSILINTISTDSISSASAVWPDDTRGFVSAAWDSGGLAYVIVSHRPQEDVVVEEGANAAAVLKGMEVVIAIRGKSIGRYRLDHNPMVVVIRSPKCVDVFDNNDRLAEVLMGAVQRSPVHAKVGQKDSVGAAERVLSSIRGIRKETMKSGSLGDGSSTAP